MASMRISDRQCAACGAPATHRSYNGHYACDEHGEAEVVELIDTPESIGANDPGYSSDEIQVTHETEAAVVRRPQHLALVRRRRKKKKNLDAGGAQPGSGQPTASTDAGDQSSSDRGGDGGGGGGGSGSGSSSKAADEEESSSVLNSFDSFSFAPSAFDTPPSVDSPSESPSSGSSSGCTTSSSTTASVADHLSSDGSSSSAPVPVMSPPPPRRHRSNSPTPPSTTETSSSNNTSVRTRRQKAGSHETGPWEPRETRSQKPGSRKTRPKEPSPSETRVWTPKSTAVRRISLDRRSAGEGNVSDGGSSQICSAAPCEGPPVQAGSKTASGTPARGLSSDKRKTSGNGREGSVVHLTTSPVASVVTPDPSLSSGGSLSGRGRVSSSGKASDSRKSRTSQRSSLGAGSAAADVPSEESKSVPSARKGSSLPPIRHESSSSAATAGPRMRRMFKTKEHGSGAAGVSKKASQAPTPKKRTPSPTLPRPPSSSKLKPPDGSPEGSASTIGNSNGVTSSSNRCITATTKSKGKGAEINARGAGPDGSFASRIFGALTSTFSSRSSSPVLPWGGLTSSDKGSDDDAPKASRQRVGVNSPAALPAAAATATRSENATPRRKVNSPTAVAVVQGVPSPSSSPSPFLLSKKNGNQKGRAASSSSSPVASAVASESSAPSPNGSLQWRGGVSSNRPHDEGASKDSRRRVVPIAPTAATAQSRRSKSGGHARKALNLPAPRKRALSPSRSSSPSKKSSRRSISSQDVPTTLKPNSVTPSPDRHVADTFIELVGDDQGATADDSGESRSSPVAREAGDTRGGGGGTSGSSGKRARNTGSVSSSSSAPAIRSVSGALNVAPNRAAERDPSSTAGGLISNSSSANAEAAPPPKRSRGRPRKYPLPPADSRLASAASASSLPSGRKLAVTSVSRSRTTGGVSDCDLHGVSGTFSDDVGGAVSPVQPHCVEEKSRDQPLMGEMRADSIGRHEKVDRNSAYCDGGSSSSLQPQQQILNGKVTPPSVTATRTTQSGDARGRVNQRRDTDTALVKIQILDVSDFLEDMPSKTTTTQITTTEVPAASLTTSSKNSSSSSPAPTTAATATKQVTSVVQTRQGRGTTVAEKDGALMMGQTASVADSSGSRTLTGGDSTPTAGGAGANISSTTTGRRKKQQRSSEGGAAAASASTGDGKGKRLKIIGAGEMESPAMNTRSSGGDVVAESSVSGEVHSDRVGAGMNGDGQCLMAAAATHVCNGSSKGKGKSRMTTRAQEAVCTFCQAPIILKHTGQFKNGFNWCNSCLKSKATCVSCFDEDLRYQMARCYDDHAWCKACLSRHLKLKVDSGETVYYDTIPCTPECGYLRGLSVPFFIDNFLSRKIEQRQVDVALLVAGKRDRSSQKLIDKNTKICPGCSVPIEKSDGCDHIHCTVCNNDFWFKCDCPYDPKKPGHLPQCNPCL